MARIAVRRRRASDADRAPLAVGVIIAGLAVGAAAGFLLGELAGPVAAAAIRRRETVARRSMAELVHDAQSALDADIQLRACALDVIPVRRGRIELHGWVADRASRARAGRLVADALPADTVVNCLLVRGEDEDHDGDHHAADVADVADAGAASS
ncbi:MAG TPA: hypothetical protein VHW65_03855 [Gemmatimonadales bacterium]|nr:hypothetical protein [Gemmatimonadales bacterium]